ncbi:right-handed parallel beta-helix repeat-containing protein, partial [Chloroflexota bacterium]
MKRLTIISLAVVLALGLSIVPLTPQPAIADPGVLEVPDGYSTISAALSAAVSGDTISVSAGNYTESIVLKSGVDIVSDRTGETKIRGNGSAPVVKANSVTNARLDGFTITGGGGQLGAGISIQTNSSNVIISNCIITGNTASVFGGGIAVYDNSSATIVNCTIVDNTANKLSDTVGGNGGGIYINTSTPVIANSIITNNTAPNSGGGIFVSNSPSANITHNDVWSNSTDDYSGIADQTGINGNISQDPQFAEAGDYHLQSGSPCIDAGDNSVPGLPDTDKDGISRIANGTVDMGVYEAGESNQSPVADAGPNQTLTLGASETTANVTLDGSGSYDNDGTVEAYTWTGTPDPADVVGPMVTLPAGTHIFTLVVEDDDGALSEEDTVTITVNETPNQPPVAD